MNKTKSMRVRLSEEEWQRVEEASISLFGVNNKSRLLRKLVRDYVGMGPDLVENELKEFRQAVRQLTGIARNLNQITTRINSYEDKFGHLSMTYLEKIKDHVTELNEQLKKYVSNTTTRFQEVVNEEK